LTKSQARSEETCKILLARNLLVWPCPRIVGGNMVKAMFVPFFLRPVAGLTRGDQYLRELFIELHAPESRISMRCGVLRQPPDLPR
jgi:hypothetical protein